MPRSIRTYFRLIAEDQQIGPVARFWQPILLLASKLYGFAFRAKQTFYQNAGFKKRLPFPVISVGNLTWGGAGKTPLVEYLAGKLCELHRVPLILTRGYSHDEIEQFKHHLPGAILGVGKNRARIAQEISKKQKISVAILDDGFQHWAIERDVEILVVNSLNPFGNEQIIPRGILREPMSALSRATMVVLTHVNLIPSASLEELKNKIRAVAPKVQLVETCMEPLFFYRANRRKRVAIQKLHNHRVATFSGIGVPRSFQLLLSRNQIKPTRNFEFSDHHNYTESDLLEIKRVSRSAAVNEIITTEKDFYRAPDAITKVLNPLVLATRLRILSGESLLTDHLFQLLGVARK